MRVKTLVALGLAKTCGAKTRKGTPCQCKRIYRGGRCKFHGGMSTGPRTREGQKRALDALRQGWLRWREQVIKGGNMTSSERVARYRQRQQGAGGNW